MTQKKSITGAGPAWNNVHIGADGQLWRWKGKYGQVVVASSGPKAVRYAVRHNWPPRLVGTLQRMEQKLV